MVVEVGPSITQNQEIRFENDQYQFAENILWGGQVNLEVAGFQLSLDGMHTAESWRMFIALSVDKINYRGIF